MTDTTTPPVAPTGAEGVVIGLKDVYIEVLQLKATLSNLESSAKSLPDHEARLRAVERWLYGVPIAVVTAIGALITQYLPGGK